MENKKYDPPRTADLPRNGNGRITISAQSHAWMPTNGFHKRAARPSWIARSSNVAMVSYCVVAVSLALTTKIAVSGDYWNLNFFLIFLQSSTAVVVMALLSYLGIISNVVGFDRKRATMWLPLSLLLVIMGYIRLKALQCLSLPTYTILTNLETMAITFAGTSASLSTSTVASFALIIMGSAGSIWSDYDIAIRSYGDKRLIQTLEPVKPLLNLLIGCVLMGGYIVLATIHSVMMRKINKKINLKDWELIWYNNILILPISATLSRLIEDFSSENINDNFPPLSRITTIISLISTCILTAFLPHISTHCIKTAGETKHAFLDAWNKIPVALCGLFFFKNQVVTADGIEAVAVAGVGGLGAVWATGREKREGRRGSVSILPRSIVRIEGGR